MIARYGKPQHLKTERVAMQVAADEASRQVGLMFVKRMGDREG